MILPFALEASILAALVFVLLYVCFLAPPRYPANIPAVPFWLTLLPFVADVDQEETYRKYLEEPLRRHGAVKIFFGARWNVLVSRPEFVSQIFRDEDLFRKSGNHEKIPGSVLAEFLGENVISAHGENWRLFKGVIKPGLTRGFEKGAEREVLERNTGRLVEMIRGLVRGNHGRAGAVPVQELLQRFTIANTGEGLFQTDFKSLEANGSGSDGLSTLQTRVKREIFKPAFMNFPFLDRLPFPSRRHARKLVEQFSRALQDGLERRRTRVETKDVSCAEKQLSPEMGTEPADDGRQLGDLLVRARDSGTWSAQQLRDNLNVLFVASQENPQIALTSTLYLLARYPRVQEKLFAELSAAATEDHISLESVPYLTATILESLRLYPPISQLINRLTTATAALSSAMDGEQVVIPKGTYVGYHAYSTNRNRDVWGPDADEFRPERWGSDAAEVLATSRRARLRGGFITFHGGRRACLGERFAMAELRVAVAGIVRALTLRLDRERVRMMPAGPLYPRALKIVFSERDGVAADGKPSA